ncbi:MAG TPA: hypothetical protein VIO33_16175 [Burkholderiaceae bacterium]
MNLALFVRAVVILVPAAIAQRCDLVEHVAYAGRPHADASLEARHLPAPMPASAMCGPGDRADCASFLDLTHGHDPG